MAVVARRPVRTPPPPPPGERFVKHRRTLRLGRGAAETGAIFVLFFAVYAVVGWRIVLVQHVVPFDALARLAHAYFVWHNAPPKLTAVGFVWPPIATLVFLPGAVIPAVATSLVALPLTSAVFAAGTVALLDRLLALCELSRKLRYPLLVGYALNPMILDYATNGMSEAVYLFFLVAAMLAFLRWYLSREGRWLIMMSFAFAFGVLSRYEVFTWAAVLTLAIGALLVRQRVTRDEMEGSLIAYLAPIAYGLGIWLLVNWLILGDPLFFLHYQTPGAISTLPNAPTPPANIPVTTVVGDLASLNWHLFPLAPLAFVALTAAFAIRRDLMAGAIAVVLVLNAALTGLLIVESNQLGFLQLRYNMRAMPLALVGVGWLHLATRDRRERLVLWVAAAAILFASWPLTWQLMKTYDFQFLEQAFTRALATGADQEGTRSIGGYVVGVKPEREMADWIAAHVHERDAILTDDAQSFPVMLLSGRPDLFVDRIDHGDAAWLDVRDVPWGRVRYALVSRIALNDLVLQRYPGLLKGLEPGWRPVHETSRWALFRVPASPPSP